MPVPLPPNMCREEAHAEVLRRLAPSHRVRPSLLSPALRAGFWALGAAAAVAPRPLSAAVTAGMQDALTDVCNEQLRQLREAGLADAAPEVGRGDAGAGRGGGAPCWFQPAHVDALGLEGLTPGPFVASARLPAAAACSVNSSSASICTRAPPHPQVRQAVREIRDEPRAVEGAPPVPDVLALQASRVWSGTV